MNNEERAERAYRLMLIYSRRLDENGDITEDLVTNLLTDLHHLCPQYGINLEEQMEKVKS
jgi:hypothetical protein